MPLNINDPWSALYGHWLGYPSMLARLVREGRPLPDEVREYLARLVEAKPVAWRRRGRPRDELKQWRELKVLLVFREALEEAQTRRSTENVEGARHSFNGTPTERAIELASERCHMSPESVSQIVHPRGRTKSPKGDEVLLKEWEQLRQSLRKGPTV